ncbi:cytochrome P450 [Saccharopolyspora shandongensis]|uniref:cytochrome P450 n=1 Tax=Saccharopolyspora shandongensis TaxID=418495 RepID=UPI00341DDDF5
MESQMHDDNSAEADAAEACPHLRQLSFTPPADRPLDDPEYFGELRRCPVGEIGLGPDMKAWMFTKFDDVKAVLGDTRFSANPTTPGFPVRGLPGGGHPISVNGMLRVDAPLHTKLRRVVTRYFTPKAVEGYRRRVTEIIDEHLERLPDLPQPLDLVSEFALSIPTTVITDLLGIPIETAPRFHELTDLMTNLVLPLDEMHEVVEEFAELSLQIADQKAKNPGDDMLTKILEEQEAVGGLTRIQLASLVTSLIVGGHDTTANMIGLSVLTLLKRPDQLALLRNGERDWDVAVEELLRVLSVARMGPRRAATEDIDVNGHVVRAGEGVIASIWSANHDESNFERTRWADFAIPETKPQHMAFSFGSHQCLGQSLARLELAIAVPKIFERYPEMKLVDPALANLSYREDRAFFGLKELLVTL